MAEKTTPFVVNDRRKFTAEGELRHDTDSPKAAATLDTSPTTNRSDVTAPEQPARTQAETIQFPSANTPQASAGEASQASTSESASFPADGEDQLPPAPTAEQNEQATRAYDATVDRLDTAIHAANPGAERIPEMSFDRFVQSLYMQAILQLGGGAEPGQQPQVDIIGARQTIDMLAILAEKTKGNLQPLEDKLLQSALFEARMAFLEITQAIARQAAGRQQGAPGTLAGGPSIVR